MKTKESFYEIMKNQPSAEAGFAKAYTDGNAPWDIGKPQSPFIAVADQIIGPVLDVGCGTGNTSLFFAERGIEIIGVDFVEEAIRRARAKASERGLTAEFLVRNAMTLDSWDRRFASIIDSGLFHVFHGEEQKKYVNGLAHVLMSGGKLFLFSFTPEETRAKETQQIGVSELQVRAIFSDKWEVGSVQVIRGELNPIFKAQYPDEFPEDGPSMLFAIIRRK